MQLSLTKLYNCLLSANRESGNRLGFVCTVLTVLVLLPHATSLANVRYVGDVSPQGDDAGGGVAGADLLIGNTDGGGIFVDFNVALDNPPFFDPLPLFSGSGNIGVTVDGVGRVEVTDNRWVLTDASPISSPDLIVGDAGFGLLDVQTSGLVDVGVADPNTFGNPALGSMVVGNAPTGQGQVTINTIVSRLRTGPLTVGEEGVGSIELNTTGNMVSTTSIVGNMDGSMGTVTLNDTSRWDLRGPLTVGNASDPTLGTGLGFVNIEEQAMLQANTAASITINSRGLINFAGGTLRQLITSPITPVVNSGVMRGDGTINAALTITPSGELRNAAATANLREYMLVSGAVTTAGTIESLGGEMEFLSTVTNTLEIIARDAVMRFPSGLINDSGGIVILGGETTIHGTIDSSGGGTIVTLPNSEILVASDIIFSSSVGSLTAAIGGSSSSLTVAGTATLDGFLALNYSGAPSVVGDSYDILFATGGIFGSFDNFGSLATADGRLWGIADTGSVLTVTAMGLAMPMGADFNGDGIVDPLDLAIWEMNFPISSGAMQTMGDADGDGDVDGADFLKIQMDFGVMPVPPIAAVPEPSAFMLALSAMGLCYRRRVPVISRSAEKSGLHQKLRNV